MANKVTGSTDITGALNIAPSRSKSVLIVGVVTGTPTISPVYNKIYTIGGTSDAANIYGAQSQIVKMVKALISNGVDYIKGIVVDNTGENPVLANKYGDAFKLSLSDDSIKCVLIDSNVTAITTALNTHLTTAESNDMFRYAVVAPDTTVTGQTDLVGFAEAINSSRIFVPGPSLVDDSGVAVAPQITMAALTGVIMTETDDPALPLNGVRLYGVGSVNRAVLDSERKLLAEGGVTALYNDSGYPTIYRLVTSDKTNAVWKEGTTRFIADTVLELVENTLRANYTRTKNVARILDSIKTDVKSVLETLEGLEIIENFDPSTLSVIKDPTDAYGALVDYEFDVVTPLYTITIKQHLVL